MGKFNKGDRVKITFEGVVTNQNSVIYWPLEGGLFVAPYSMYSPISIERIEPTLKVGDTARWTLPSAAPGLTHQRKGKIALITDAHYVMIESGVPEVISKQYPVERIA